MGGQDASPHETQAPVLVTVPRPPSEDARIHSLPCTVEYDGPAAVSTYFMPKAAKDTRAAAMGSKDDGLLQAQFRGRELKGIKAKCPRGTVGLVAREMTMPPELRQRHDTAANRFWSIDSTFEEITLWQHDFPPPEEHCMHQVKEWLEVAQSVHDDVD